VDNGNYPPDNGDEPENEQVPLPMVFTLCAERCLARAEEEAIALGDDFVGSDHLLIALAEDSGGAASRVLIDLGNDADVLRSKLVFIRGTRQTGPVGLPLPRSSRLDHVVQMAGVEASLKDARSIGTLHLLMALLKERKGVGIFLLESPGVGLERAGGALARAFREGAVDSE
jgi:ATP-dependent Clp protease ATP-binding subunit ClpC